MTQVKPTTTAMIAATIGLVLFSVPTITGLSFAADDGSSSTSATPTTTGDQKSGSDSSSSSSDSKPQTPDQPQQPQQQPQQQEPPKDPTKRIVVCNELRVDFGCGGPIKIVQPTKVIVHHSTTIKTVHDKSLTVAQQNCTYSALQLGFSSNAQNRADATYAAILGCLGSSA